MASRPELSIFTQRTRLLSLVLVLGIFAALPLPAGSKPWFEAALLVLLYVSVGALAWSLWFRPDLRNIFWAFGMILSLLAGWTFSAWLPLCLFALWAAWFRTRQLRAAKLGQGILTLALLATSSLWAQGTTTSTSLAVNYQLPAQLSGKTIEALASCLVIDQIPWVFRKTERQSRLLIKDRLRLNTQPDFALWEIHQVIDEGGYIAYVFKKPLPNGNVEVLVTKESFYNRILETPKERRVIEARNLKNFVDRPALTFVSERGGSVVFMPGLAGLTKLVINFSSQSSRPVPSVQLAGKECDRLGESGFTEKDATSGAAPAKTAVPAAAAAAGGAK